MDQKREYHFTEDEVREWLLGFDVIIHLDIYLESKKGDFDKEYLINQLLERYRERMNQKIGRFHTAE
jgi:hypothetical protein